MNRPAAAVGLALAVLVGAPACTDDDAGDQVVTAPTTTSTAGPEEPAPSTTVTTAPVESQPVLWPASATVLDDPAEAAAGFVTELLGGAPPSLGEFAAGEPGAGEIEVLRVGEGGGVGGIRSVLSLRQVGGGWFVTSAQSPVITIDSPEALEVVSGTVDVTGTGRGFEGTLLVSLRTAGQAGPVLAETFVTAGALEQPEPFATRLDVSTAGPGTALALVVGNENAADGDLGEFTAVALVAAP